MGKEIVKFKAKLNTKYPQLFPTNNKPYKDNEFAILNFDLVEILQGNVVENKYGNITVKGEMPYINDFHKTYVILAEVEYHPVYGNQYLKLMMNEDISFDNIQQQKIFLQTFLTDTQIKNLYEIFENPVNIIEEKDIENLCKVKGIGEKKATRIIEKYEENKDYSEAYIELSTYGLTPNMIRKMVDEYGSPKILINKIKKNPYVIASEINGIGFKRADEMALNNGINNFSQIRLRAFIKHILNEGAMIGYSWISSDVLIYKIQEELDKFPLEDIVEAVSFLKESKVIWNGEKGKVALQKYYNLENKIKNELIRIRDAKNDFDFNGWEDRVKQAEILQGWKYTIEQKKAIEMVLNEQLTIITGKAGSGKTSTALGAIKSLGDISFAQTALAGKASARMQEVTGYEGYTIHRLLGFNPNNYEDNNSVFLHNKNNPLKLDVVLLDEFPMVGGRLFLNLLEAIPTGSKLILLGDKGQLPAIGSLNIGSDLTESSHVATTILTKIHRQALKSAIITESLKISNGEQIIEEGWTGKEKRGELQDLELDIHNNKDLSVDKCIEHFKEKLKMSKNDVMEVQVIVPMSTRGDSCVYNLNNVLQPLYNPKNENKKEVFLGLSKDKGYTLRVGDKIINMKNNYKMHIVEQEEIFGFNEWMKKDNEIVAIFNGYMGEIIDIYDDNLIVYFPLVDKTVAVESKHWKKEKGIHLAYASTVHKQQGSSSKYVIGVIDYSQYIMLSRELIYTLMTRASKHCVLIAENRALRYATTQTAIEEKQTFLKELLNK